MPPRRPIRSRVPLDLKLIMLVVLVALTTAVTSGAFMYQAQRLEVEQMLGKLLVNIARTGALFIDGDAHDRILGNLQADSYDYKRIRSLLRRIQQENDLNESAIYTCRRLNQSTMEIVVSVDRPRVGEYYDPPPEPREKILALYASGEAQFTTRHERNGRGLISALAPIRNARDEVVGYLEVDYPTDVYAGTLQERVTPLLTGLGMGTIAALIISTFLFRGVTAPIKQVIGMVRQITEGGGDLTQRIEFPARDVLGLLASEINAFIALMQRLVRRLVDSVRAVETFSRRISSISEAQVLAASEQAAAIDETTRTIHNLVRTFEDTQGRTVEVASQASAALERAKQGDALLAETVKEMNRVKSTSVETVQEIYELVQRSHQIGEVMALIHDVAAKTKLIAFNAAIEASAAGGESGRRFSIVAQEVRHLAERVVKSTADIEEAVSDMQARVKQLIQKTEENFRKVERGFDSALQAKQSIEVITGSVARTEEAAGVISQTTRAQELASDQILTALANIEGATREFEQSIQEMKDTADALASQFTDLGAAAGKFKI